MAGHNRVIVTDRVYDLWPRKNIFDFSEIFTLKIPYKKIFPTLKVHYKEYF